MIYQLFRNFTPKNPAQKYNLLYLYKNTSCHQLKTRYMSVKCDIHLEPLKDGIFRSGDIIPGYISYTIDKETKYKTIVISLAGNASTRFKTGTGESEKTVYESKDISEDIATVSNGGGEDKITYGPGTYTSEFTFKVPKGIPSSYRDLNGAICYKLKVVFQKSGLLGFIPKEFSKPITIRGNIIPTHTEHPMTFGVEKTFFTSQDTIFIKAKVNNTCLKPGEHMIIDSEVKNKTEIEIKQVIVNLFSKAVHKELSGFHEDPIMETKTLFTAATDIKPRSVAVGKLDVEIPNDAYTIQHCEIISRTYEIRFIFNLSLPHMNAVLVIPIDIGETSMDQEQKKQDPEV